MKESELTMVLMSEERVRSAELILKLMNITTKSHVRTRCFRTVKFLPCYRYLHSLMREEVGGALVTDMECCLCFLIF